MTESEHWIEERKYAFFADGTEEYRIPAEPEPGETVRLRFRAPAGVALTVFLHLLGERAEEMRPAEEEGDFVYYEASVELEDYQIAYFFSVETEERRWIYDRRGLGEEVSADFCFKLTPGFFVPEWAKGAVMYQIFVDRFCNGDTTNSVVSGEYFYLGRPVVGVEDWFAPVEGMDVHHFYGGDLAGVRKKLDYLQTLGVEVIYFNPLFVSPSNHKYDSQDYDHIDPHLGVIVKDIKTPEGGGPERYVVRTTARENLEASNAYFADLMKEIHRRGMKVILDGVFNHCGSFHKWMDREGFYEDNGGYAPGAYRSKQSPYRSFFRFRDPDDCNSYESWWGYETLPKLNYEQSEALCDEICRIGAMWVSEPYCVDGWRLDVAADLGHSGEFNHKFWKRFRKAVKEANPQAVILAEHYGDAEAWLQGDEWDTVMNYDAFMEPLTWFLTGMEKHSDEFRGHLWNNEEYFLSCMTRTMAKMQTSSLLCAMNELSNHDHSRFLTRTNHRTGRVNVCGPQAAGEGVNRAVFAEAVVFQMMWPGAPTVYYGDEAGLCGFTDPDNRRPYPWGCEDKELIGLHRELIRIHRSYRVLRRGALRLLHCEHGILSFGRFDRRDQIFTALNNNDNERTICFSVKELGVSSASMVSLMRTGEDGFYPRADFYRVTDGAVTLTLPPHSAVVLKNYASDRILA